MYIVYVYVCVYIYIYVCVYRTRALRAQHSVVDWAM